MSMTLFRSIRCLPFLCMLMASGAAAQSMDGDYSGRYLCAGRWNTVELQITASGNGQISGVFTAPTRDARGNTSKSSYALRGRYDETSGRFRLDPQAWIGRAPAGYIMVGLEGTFNPRTLKLNGRITNPACGAFDLAMNGAAGSAPSRPPQAPPQSPPAARSPIANPAQNENPFSLPPERRPFPTDAAGESFEYLDAAMSDAKGAARESEPIDDVNEWLKNEKFFMPCDHPCSVEWSEGRSHYSSSLKGTLCDRM